MKNLSSQRGSTSTIVTISLLGLMLLAALVFGVWAYMERTKYKTSSDEIVAVAVKDNTKKVQAEDAIKYAEAAKLPYQVWVGPATFGSVEITYPKTWSVYSEGQTASSAPVNVFMHPDTVPSTKDPGSSYALRTQVVPNAYSSVLNQFAGLQKTGKVTISAYALPKNPSDVGSKISGQVAPNKQGTMVIFPLRDKTLKIWTESPAFQADFDNIILPNAHFSP
ncbi:MAG: hypothetical protein WAS36_02800 [Candidatus Saccharimonadales bacterium]